MKITTVAIDTDKGAAVEKIADVPTVDLQGNLFKRAKWQTLLSMGYIDQKFRGMI